jgi:hypothetical protein
LKTPFSECKNVNNKEVYKIPLVDDNRFKAIFSQINSSLNVPFPVRIEKDFVD